MVKTNNKVTWITPIGMVVNATYQLFKSKQTKAFAISMSKPITLSIPTGQIDVVKSKRAFLANLVHSLDGSNIHLLIRLINQSNPGIPIYTVHDCFATTPNNMQSLERLVKDAFISIYFGTQGYMKKIHDHILDDLRTKFDVKNLVEDNELVYENGQEVLTVQVNKEKIRIPTLPASLNNRNDQDFIDGILASQYFIP